MINDIPTVHVPNVEAVVGWYTSDEVGAALCESPVSTVRLSEYYIMKYVLSVSEWNDVIDAANREEITTGLCHREVEFADSAVVNVSWFEAVEFASIVSRLTGMKWRLPTECEWEYAARGPHGYKFPWGSDASVNPSMLQRYVLSEEPRRGRSPMLRESPVGCAGMWEIVSEWCLDEAVDKWYGGARWQCTDPLGSGAPRYRSFRGGSLLDAAWPRCSFRGYAMPDFKSSSLGIRLVHDGGRMMLRRSVSVATRTSSAIVR